MTTILFPMDDPKQFKNMLYDQYNIEIPILTDQSHPMIRVSYQGYNSDTDADYLIETLKKLI